jgi:two-component system, response regulator
MKEIEILLVEDNPEDAELTIDALREQNLSNTIQVVEDGELALDFLYASGKYSNRETENKPKLVLLDLKLPKVSGLEVLQKIKSDEKLKTIPVVVLTSSEEESDIIKSYELGVNSYIVKPVNFDQFTKSVKELGLYWLVLNKQ